MFVLIESLKKCIPEPQVNEAKKKTVKFSMPLLKGPAKGSNSGTFPKSIIKWVTYSAGSETDVPENQQPPKTSRNVHRRPRSLSLDGSSSSATKEAFDVKHENFETDTGTEKIKSSSIDIRHHNMGEVDGTSEKTRNTTMISLETSAENNPGKNCKMNIVNANEYSSLLMVAYRFRTYFGFGRILCRPKPNGWRQC